MSTVIGHQDDAATTAPGAKKLCETLVVRQLISSAVLPELFEQLHDDQVGKGQAGAAAILRSLASVFRDPHHAPRPSPN